MSDFTAKSRQDGERFGHPSISDAVIFRVKALLLQLSRGWQDFLVYRTHRYSRSDVLSDREIIAESATKLWTHAADAELALQAGKVHNLRIALRQINGVEIPANGTFSFWAQVGRASKWKGYVAGRELREGCLIPSIGGGLCQLSNALYDAALSAGFDIIERHAHTQVIPGSLAEAGRDATVFWNYVDLRFRSKEAFRIEAFMTHDHLTVRLRGYKNGLPSAPSIQARHSLPSLSGPNTCAGCGVHTCFRNAEPGGSALSFGRAAYLVDEYWPEFDQYLEAQKSEADWLILPLDGRKFKKPNYAWDTTGFHQVREKRWVAALRALESRRLAAQGAARQKALLKYDEKLALSFASSLTPDVIHVTMMQNLLPFLWRGGYLGGRTFDVLMTRLPVASLQKRLDAAYRLHPESVTLADYRADRWLIEAESQALRQARKIITPHTEIAGLFQDQAVLLDWRLPLVKTRPAKGAKIIFPAPTVGRKGAYELRQVAKELNLELVVLGSQLEGKGFWGDVRIECGNLDKHWLDQAGVVVLPAFIEHKPRRLLEAIACGIPVIASSACGLEGVGGVVTIPIGDPHALASEIKKTLSK